MIQQNDLIKFVVQAGEGSITGRIRIQKIFYLLDQLGLESGAAFSYHHYGPYSEDLYTSIEQACKIEKTVQEQIVPSDGGFYSIYSSTKDKRVPSQLGKITWDKACSYIQAMKSETSVVLELAATIHWLSMKERVKDWKKELKVRKGSKAEDSRIEKAMALLDKLGLQPTS